MKRFAENLQFEEAQKRKLSLEALSSLDTLQVVRDGVK
jgi:excinuclease UvrABC nuclease subunit